MRSKNRTTCHDPDAGSAGLALRVTAGGFASGILNPITSALVFERVPEALVGRVTALGGAMAWALMPFAGIRGGVLISAFGLAAAMMACGLAYLAVALAPLALRQFRAIDAGRRAIAGP